MLFLIVACIALAAASVFVALYLGVQGVQASPRTELKRRLRNMGRESAQEMPPGLKSEITREMAPADRFLSRLPLLRGMDRRLDQAGLRLTVSGFVLGCAAATLVAAALAGYLTGSALIGAAAAGGSLLCTGAFLRLKTRQRAEKFSEQFPDALTVISRSLQAGHSFNTAIQLVGQEIPNPAGELFKMAFDQQQLGLRITDGLTNLNERISSLDLRFFTTVVSINSEIGGSLSEILEKLAHTIRERHRIRRQVRVYTAQGRMSGYVLGALPIVAFAAFSVLNPQYESVLIRDPMGIKALVLVFCMQLMGLLIIRKIIRIKI